jgi:hypothetical protein
MGGACSKHGRDENAYKILDGKSEGKRLLGRTNCRWDDNMKMNLKEIGYERVDWIYLAPLTQIRRNAYIT